MQIPTTSVKKLNKGLKLLWRETLRENAVWSCGRPVPQPQALPQQLPWISTGWLEKRLSAPILSGPLKYEPGLGCSFHMEPRTRGIVGTPRRESCWISPSCDFEVGYSPSCHSQSIYLHPGILFTVRMHTRTLYKEVIKTKEILTCVKYADNLAYYTW